MSLESKQVEFAVGIVGIVVGLAGIYFSVLGLPNAIDAMSGHGLPGTAKDAAGGLMVFSIVLVLLIALAGLFVGLWFLLRMMLERFEVEGGKYWAVAILGAFVWLSFTITLLLYSVGAGAVFVGVSTVSAMHIGQLVEMSLNDR